MTPRELVERWLDGVATPEETAELDRLLAADPDVAALFAKASRRDRALAEQFQEARVAGRIRALAPRRRVWIATAAAAALLGAAVLLLSGERAIEGPRVLHWDDGATTIRLREGATLVVLDEDPKLFELRAGELEAVVAPQKAPMVVRTPHAEAVVLGTRFTLSAGADTRLEVSEGRVRFSPGDFRTPPLEVAAGQVARSSAPKVLAKEVDRFLEHYRAIHDPKSGYFSPDGVPYHSVETLIVDAPDHGHLSTSETFSYWIWLEAAYGRVSGDWAPFRKAWAKMEEVAIPSPAEQPTNRFYNPEKPLSLTAEGATIDAYPVGFVEGKTGPDLLHSRLPRDLYLMHWLIDADDVYGFGRRGRRGARNGLVNTFQRGPEESVWETIPHPSWEDFQAAPNGFLDLFIREPRYARQWRYVSAPDAEARALQAAYWALRWAKAGTPLPTDKAARMGDALRYALRDRALTGTHGLIGWSVGWGGSIDETNGWAWRSGASHAHFGYQNPVAAWALATVPELRTTSGAAEWKASLDAQLEHYAKLQSPEGAIQGGYRIDGASLSFEAHPVFRDPPSNEWFGWQAWSMDRLAQYYQASGDARARPVLERWIAWAKRVVKVAPDGYAIPGTLAWDGSSVRVSSETQDVGVAGATARALAFWGAAAKDVEARALAGGLLDRIWALHRDAKGVSNPEERPDYARFHEKVFLPAGWAGRRGSTFLELRPWFRRDADWPRVEAALRRGEPPRFRYHRFWAQVEVAVANAEFARLFSE